jgi:hypothetical protein
MKKLALLGAAQSPRQSVFQIEKKNHCVEAVRNFLHELGFASWDTAKLFGPLGGGDTGKPTMKYVNAAYDDKFFALQKGQYTVQVFFGKKKVTISVLTLNDEQEKLKEKILLFTERKDAPTRN